MVGSCAAGGVVDYAPAVSEENVYVGANYPDNKLYALNATTGKLLWSFAGGANYGMNGPSVANGVVYVGSNDHHLYALNARNGALLWGLTTGDFVVSTTAIAGG